MDIPRGVAFRMIYLGIATACLLSLLGISTSLRRNHALDRFFWTEGRAVGISPALLSAVAWKESRYKSAALGTAGEIGIMQITQGAAEEYARENRVAALPIDKLWNPELNTRIGAWYLHRAHQYWRAQGVRRPLAVALAEYNAGRKNARTWATRSQNENTPFHANVEFETTSLYIISVLSRYSHGG